MNNATFNKKSSQPSKSVKQFHRVEAQLASRKKAKGEVIPETVTAPVSEIEIIPASTFLPVEKVPFVEAETAEPSEIAPDLELRTAEQSQRKMLAKVKRAFLKAGVEAGPEAQADFLNELLLVKVPVLNRSSGRIARVVKGEESIATLLLLRAPKKSA
jgi:hypothetical protein